MEDEAAKEDFDALDDIGDIDETDEGDDNLDDEVAATTDTEKNKS